MSKIDTEFYKGRKFGEWTVIGDSEKDGYIKCQCSCGKIQDVCKSPLRTGKTKSCRKCANTRMGPYRSQAFLQKQRDKYIGKITNGWKVTDVYKNPDAKNNDLFCKATCPKCGKEVDMRLTNIKIVSKCMKCTNNIIGPSKVVKNVTNMDGTSLVSLKARVEGKVNRNSTTGYNGVFKDGNRYRASICFKGKRIYLGSYSTLKEAVNARKSAEQITYEKYLAEHKGWEQELKNKLAESKNEKNNE